MSLLRIFFIVALFTIKIYSQNPNAIKLTENENLPANEIYDVAQDKNGYIWLSSSKGLIRYDGVNFKTYKSNYQTSISGSTITEDIYGRIWYENFDGFLYYVENNQLKNLKQNKPVGYLPFGITKKHLFVIQKEGVDVFDLKTLKLTKTINIPISIAEDAVTFNDEFYFITDNILFKIDRSLNLHRSDYFKDKNLHVKYVFAGKNEIYVLSKLNETNLIYFLSSNLSVTKTHQIPGISIIQGSNLIDNNLWIHTSNGTYNFDLSKNKLNNHPYFKHLSISKIIKDDKNNYWFSSVTDGIRIVPSLNNQFIKLSDNGSKTIIKHNNHYLIGTASGEVLKSNLTDNSTILLHKIKENLPTYYLYYDSISDMTFFSNKGFYIAKNGDYINATNYDIALKEVVRLDDWYYAFASSNFVGLIKNPNSKNYESSIWNSIFKENKSQNFNDIAVLKQNIRAKSISFDPNNQTLYFSTNIGSFQYQKNKLSEILIKNNPFYTNKIFRLNNKNYALSTKGNLYELLNNTKLINLNTKLNLEDGSIQYIKVIDNKLYFIANEALYAYENNKLKKLIIPVQTHLINDFYVNNDQLNLLTNNGLIQLKLTDQLATQVKRFHIDHLIANDKIYNWKTKQFFTSNENNIKIDFSLLEYVNKNTPIYYRINNEKWILTEKNARTLEFPSLAVGKYTITFKIDSEIYPQQIRFEIELPFWKKWWFYLIVSVVFVLILFFYFRWLSRNIKLKMQLLNDKVKLEKDLSKSVLTSIKSQMNPHFFYNALNTIQAYIFKNDKEKANSYLAKFSKLTRMILEMSEKETVSLQEEIQSIKLYLELEQMRFSDDFSYEILVSPEIQNDIIELPPMMLQPYIENAIKHGLLHSKNNKKIYISFEKQENTLKVVIDDNGVGRKRASEINQQKTKIHQSFATNANEKRLEILNKGRSEKIAVEFVDKYSNGIANGTQVILTIPIN